MPQDITINGAQYPDVPAVQIPKTGGGTAQFDDTTDATATASEIASGKTAYVNNTRLVGTGQMVEPPLYIDPSINGVGIGATPENDHELTIANGYHINAKGKDNRLTYMPYSWATNGGSTSDGYVRIASVHITATFFMHPIKFTVTRLADKREINLSLFIQGTSGTTAPLSVELYYDGLQGIGSSFDAYAYKADTSVVDVYVKKYNSSDYITVTTYMAQWSQARGYITYNEGFATTVPSSAVLATQLPIVNTVKHNAIKYQPYSWQVPYTVASGGYQKIAVVQITGSWADAPIHFRVVRRMDDKTLNLYLRFASVESTDPAVSVFYYDTQPNFGTCYVIRENTSTWGVYAVKRSGSDYMTVYVDVPEFMQNRCNVYQEGGYSATVPSGAVTASPMPVPFDTPALAPVRKFGVGANSSRTIAFTEECSFLLSVTGWNPEIRSALYFISGYSDSSRADITVLKSATGISVTAVSGSLAWTISNSKSVGAWCSIIPMWGGYPVIT